MRLSTYQIMVWYAKITPKRGACLVLVESGPDAHLICWTGQAEKMWKNKIWRSALENLSSDLIFLSGRRRGGRGDPRCCPWVTAQSCGNAIIPSDHEQNWLQQWGWQTTRQEGGGADDDGKQPERLIDDAKSWEYHNPPRLCFKMTQIIRAIGIPPYPPPFLFALLNNGANQVSL